jgi:hypothetical protein
MPIARHLAAIATTIITTHMGEMRSGDSTSPHVSLTPVTRSSSMHRSFFEPSSLKPCWIT